MSAHDLLTDLLRDAEKRARMATDTAYQAQIGLIKHQAGLRSLLAHLRMAADDLAKTKPIMCDRYREVANTWEKYCEEPQQSLGEVACMDGSVPGHSGPEASAQVETPVGDSKSTYQLPYLDSPIEVRLEQWDSTAPTAGGVKP